MEASGTSSPQIQEQAKETTQDVTMEEKDAKERELNIEITYDKEEQQEKRDPTKEEQEADEMLRGLSTSSRHNGPTTSQQAHQELELLAKPQIQEINNKVAPICQETK